MGGTETVSSRGPGVEGTGSAHPPGAVHFLKRPPAVRKHLRVCLRSHRATAVPTPRHCSLGVAGDWNWNKRCHGLNSHVECWSRVLKYPEHLNFKGDTSLSGSAYPKCQGHKSCVLVAIKTQKDTCTLTKREHSGWSGEEAGEAVRNSPQKHHCSFHEPTLSKRYHKVTPG